jgi:hypothetical protein
MNIKNSLKELFLDFKNKLDIEKNISENTDYLINNTK